MLPTSTWKIFKELRTIGRKLVNYKSHEEFNGICVKQGLVALGLRHKRILGIQEYELQEFYETQMKNAEKEVQRKVYEFYKKGRQELQKNFQKCKSELFRSTNGAEAYKVWNKVKQEMNRSEYTVLRIKNNKLDKLKKENEKSDLQDLRSSYTQNKRNSEIGKIRTERVKSKTKRKLRQVKERKKKIKNRKRRHKRKQRLMDIKTKLKETENRNNGQVKPQVRTDYQWSEADINLCNKSQKFVPTPERRNLDEKITEFF